MTTATHHHPSDHHPSDHYPAQHHGSAGLRSMSASAALHCLTGCAIGEILGLIIGTALGLHAAGTAALAITLAFGFGYALSTLPLLRAGLGLKTALRVVLAADTLSIASMEIADNAVMAVIPGAMTGGLVSPVFWVAMMIALTVAFFVAWPVNLWLLRRGRGHALTHAFHGAAEPTGVRRFIPVWSSAALAASLIAFMLGGLLVSLAQAHGFGGH